MVEKIAALGKVRTENEEEVKKGKKRGKRSTSGIRINTLDEDPDDPFGLMSGKSPGLKIPETQKNRSNSAMRGGRDPKEIFVEIYGIKTEKQVVPFDDELDRQQRRR